MVAVPELKPPPPPLVLKLVDANPVLMLVPELVSEVVYGRLLVVVVKMSGLLFRTELGR